MKEKRRNSYSEKRKLNYKVTEADTNSLKETESKTNIPRVGSWYDQSFNLNSIPVHSNVQLIKTSTSATHSLKRVGSRLRDTEFIDMTSFDMDNKSIEMNLTHSKENTSTLEGPGVENIIDVNDEQKSGSYQDSINNSKKSWWLFGSTKDTTNLILEPADNNMNKENLGNYDQKSNLSIEVNNSIEDSLSIKSDNIMIKSAIPKDVKEKILRGTKTSRTKSLMLPKDAKVLILNGVDKSQPESRKSSVISTTGSWWPNFMTTRSASINESNNNNEAAINENDNKKGNNIDENNNESSSSWASYFKGYYKDDKKENSTDKQTKNYNNKEENLEIVKEIEKETKLGTENKPNLVLPIFNSEAFSYQMNKMDSNSPLLTTKTLGKAINKVSDFIHFSKKMEIKSKKIMIIGIHGWFPLKIYQKVIGEPTGTSEKFCSKMKQCILKYFKNKNYSIEDSEIYEVSLCGEGKVDRRIEKLYHQFIDNDEYIKQLSLIDTLFICTHSQGTPVSVGLLAKLYETHYIHWKIETVGLLAMAGISHGPFRFLKQNYLIQYFESESARELFSFIDVTSEVVKNFYKNMTLLLSKGVKVLAVGSMLDQVVPLYSALMVGFEHCNILRAVYIDGIDYEQNFLTSIIVFSILLRNYGVKDGDLLIHLSEFVDGSLYSGTPGHSTIYEEDLVYNLMLDFIYETQPIKNLEMKIGPIKIEEELNPFYLPWIMRGILELEEVHKNPMLKIELDLFLQQFLDWKPKTKLLKELKFRLEPIKSSL